MGSHMCLTFTRSDGIILYIRIIGKRGAKMQNGSMIRYAEMRDFEVIKRHDSHISEEELKNIIPLKRVIVMYQGESFAGWLRFGMFWENIPFMNMLYILEDFRGKGAGTALVRFWEEETSKSGYRQVLTSTQSNERAQFFYRKIGYTECGALLLPNEPLEMVFMKRVGEGKYRGIGMGM